MAVSGGACGLIGHCPVIDTPAACRTEARDVSARHNILNSELLPRSERQAPGAEAS